MTSILRALRSSWNKVHKRLMEPGLKEYGLYYEDMIEYPEDVVKVALSRLPEDIQMDRRRRRFRANELNLKHETLPTDLQDYDPFVSYGLSREYQRALKEKQEMHRSW